ncbi:unnamed protein product [Phyllotreta striolata]|uniref:PNT domain-containing protein n=1 Tax=Phyllotreta striolata TaxID=444603 RepID=A0A9N9TLC6_PHYSR|nr:unnamed protein product [Phyllotreta striolata]
MALQTAEILVQYGLRTEWEEAFNCGESQTIDHREDDDLPRDPRQWTRENVADWLKFVMTKHNLPEVQSSRFLMNGKALCLMSPGMFLKRAPLGGKLLYKDFQLRLSSALYTSN